MRLVQEAKARFDPEQPRPTVPRRRTHAASTSSAQVSYDGTVHVEGDLDLADAYDLNTAGPRVPPSRRTLGSLDVPGCAPVPATWPGSSRSSRRSPPSRSASACGNPNTTVTVKPVLDLAEHIWVMSYEASDLGPTIGPRPPEAGPM